MLYLSPTNDLAFKKLFGTDANKDLLISFLNSILERKGDKLIVSVDFNNPYNHLPSLEQKLSIVDVKCTDKAKNIYIVEMQVNKQHDFLARCQYYASCGLSMQLAESEAYKKLFPVIFIGVADFKIFSDHNRYLSHYQFLDSIDHVCRLHHTEYHFVELKKFKKTVEQLENIADKWIYFLQNAERCENTPQELQKTQPLVKAFDVLERGRWNTKELEEYEKFVDARRVEKSALETAKIDERQEIAKKMLLENAKIEFICKVTGLSKKEIEELKAELKNEDSK
jgi:conserved hypothetical protein (putative transposase or invertase)